MQSVATDEDVALYEPPERKVQLSARIPAEVREGLDEVVRLWKVYAEARGDNPEKIDLTHVLVRMLRVGTDQAFAEVGGRPLDEKGWELVTSQISKAVKSSKR